MISLKNRLVITDNIDEAREKLFISENSGDGSSFFMGINPGIEIFRFDDFIKNEVSYFWKVLNEKSPYELPIFISYSEALIILSMIIDKAKVTDRSFFGLRIFSNTMAKAIFNRVRDLGLLTYKNDMISEEGRSIKSKLVPYFDIKSYIHPAINVNEDKLRTSIKCYEKFFKFLFESSILDDSMARILYYTLIQDEKYIEDFKNRYSEIEFINPSRYLSPGVLKEIEKIVSTKVIDEKNLVHDIIKDISLRAEVEKFELYSEMVDYARDYIMKYNDDSVTIFESYESKILSYRMNTDFGIKKYKSIFDDIYGLIFLSTIYRMKNHNFFGDDFKYFQVNSFIRKVDKFSEIIKLKSTIEKGAIKNSMFKEEFLDESLEIFFDMDFKDFIKEMKDYPDEIGVKVSEIIFNTPRHKGAGVELKENNVELIDNNLVENKEEIDGVLEGKVEEIKNVHVEKSKDAYSDSIDDFKDIDRLKIYKRVMDQYLHFDDIIQRLNLDEDEEIYLIKNILEKYTVPYSDVDNSKRVNIIRGIDMNFVLPKGRVIVFDYTNPYWDNKEGDFIGEILLKKPSKREELARYLKKNQTNIDELVILASAHSVEGYEQDKYLANLNI